MIITTSKKLFPYCIAVELKHLHTVSRNSSLHYYSISLILVVRKEGSISVRCTVEMGNERIVTKSASPRHCILYSWHFQRRRGVSAPPICSYWRTAEQPLRKWGPNCQPCQRQYNWAPTEVLSKISKTSVWSSNRSISSKCSNRTDAERHMLLHKY
jgi:hypothetical protein